MHGVFLMHEKAGEVSCRGRRVHGKIKSIGMEIRESKERADVEEVFRKKRRYKVEEEKLERSIRKSEIPGLTREEEEAQLAKVIGIAEQNLEQAKADIRLANEDLADLMETYDAKEAEGLALWNNATAKLNAYQHGMARLEKEKEAVFRAD